MIPEPPFSNKMQSNKREQLIIENLSVEKNVVLKV